jgi:hypothetical protein
MRIVLTGLIAAAGIATVAYAQQPATPGETAPAPAPAAQPPAPAEAAPAAPSSTLPAATPAAPPVAGQPAPPAATPAAPAPAPEAPPPTLPTSGPGAAALQVLEKVCVPAVRGQKLETIAKAAGFKLDRRNQWWEAPFNGDKKYQVIVFPLGSNTNVCNVEFHYPAGSDAEIVEALNIWAFLHKPPLEPTANYTQPVDPDGLKRVRRSWEYLNPPVSVGLNFSTVRKPDNTQVNSKYDMGTMQYQERQVS